MYTKLLEIISLDTDVIFTDQIFKIRHILNKTWKYNGLVHQLLTEFKKAYDFPFLGEKCYVTSL
jgi:hypothetical protein